MGKALRADYSRQFLLPPSLEEWVPRDHPVRFLRDFVDSLDMKSLGFRLPALREGRPPYSVEMLLKVWLYGYLEKIRSSRGLERACYSHLPLIWLTGMHYPDHNTLWRFLRDNRSALRGVFRQVVLIAYKSGLVGLALHAVDGTKIEARSSKRGCWDERELQELLQRLDSSIDEMISAVESAEDSDSGEYRLPEELLDAQKRRSEIKEQLSQLSEVDVKHLHPGERDARMQKSGMRHSLGYNAQVVVDDESSLILAAEVVNARSDNDMLVGMVEQVSDNVGQAAEETVADAGYYSPDQLAAAEERDLDVLVSIPRWESSQGEFGKCRFEYDQVRDVYICPRGEVLSWERRKLYRSRNEYVDVYRCQSYGSCPVRWRCSPQKSGRRVQRRAHEEAVVRQRAKQADQGKKDLLRKRMVIVEPVFAYIKEQMGFRRWTTKDLSRVRAQWSLICTAFNLKKMHRYWLRGRLALR
jgi:transposase